jgi:glycosyltransferase involved in cell wall biosynthesis
LYRFKIIKEFDNRENTVGYIGRFSKEKGILNFVQAMQFLLKEKSSIQFLLCGSGELLREVKKSIKNENLGTNVKLRDWVPHEKIPELLNELKLLILPSYTEGLPNIMLEAMACGTPVLAMPVGAIPDIIKDGETGFLLKSNHPKHIADKIIELLNKPELLEKVSKNAYNYVRENSSYEKTLESWRKIIREIEAQK